MLTGDLQRPFNMERFLTLDRNHGGACREH